MESRYGLNIGVGVMSDLEDINSTIKEKNNDIAEILYAMLCKDSDMWRCEYTAEYKDTNYPYGSDEFMLKMEINGHTSYEDIRKIITDGIKQEMKWSDNEMCDGFVCRNKTNTEFTFDCRNDRVRYSFKITKVY